MVDSISLGSVSKRRCSSIVLWFDRHRLGQAKTVVVRSF